MKRLEFDERHKLADVLKAISEEPDEEVEIFVFPGSDILKLSANTQAINHLAKKLSKKVTIKGDFDQNPPSPPTQKPEENLGFVEGTDVAATPPPAPKPEPVVEKARSSFVKLLKFPKLPFPKGRKKIYFAAGGLAALIVFILLIFYFVPNATVKLITQPQFKEAELALVASAATEEVSLEEGTIPLKQTENTQEDVVEAKATGTKTVGTNAKGRIKIINRDTKEKKFFAGTEVKTIKGSTLIFTLDDTATMSAAPLACITDCPETAVNVTAKQIGEESNVKVGTKFQVGSVTDTTKVVGEALVNFTGGSSKKITVVSAADQKKAKEELLKKLETSAREELQKENPDIIIPEGGLESEVIEEVYSKKIGDEASDFRLSLQVKFTAKAFSSEDIKNIMIESINESIPSGFVIDRDASSVEVELLESEGEELKVLGKIKAALVPDLNKDKVKKEVAGKDFASTDKYLKSIASIAGFEIKISPSPFRILGFMPFRQSGIKIEIVQEE